MISTTEHEDSLMMSVMGQSIRKNLGEYKIVEELSHGGSGFVFKIREIKKKTEYALKVINKVSPNTNAKLQSKVKARVENEISLHKQLNECENIIFYKNRFEDQDNWYIVLELCESGDITQYIKNKGKLQMEDIKLFASHIAQGLRFIHGKQIVHRDIKPNNVLISNNKIAKICDLGLAAKGDSFGDLVGTLNYSAPEIICNEGKYQQEIDMWSFGCTLYYMATGSQLFNFSKRSEAVNYYLNNQLSIKFPENFDKSLQQLIRNLVVMNPKARLTSTSIFQSDFFNPNKKETTQLSPLKTINLESTTLELQQGIIIINQNGLTKPSSSIHPFDFHINQMGTLITVKKSKQQKNYSLKDLPQKYHSLYSYCKNVIEILEGSSSKSIFKNQKGIFKIFKSGNFIASFANGKTVYLKDKEVLEGKSEVEEIKLAKKYYNLMKELN